MNHSVRPLAAVIAGVTLVGITACSSPATSAQGPSSGSPVSITFSSYNYGTQGAAGTGTQALLDAFAKVHPEITVVPQAVPTADVLTKAKTDVAAGAAPDVVQLGYSKLSEAFQTLPVQSIEKIAGNEWSSHVAGIAKPLVDTGQLNGSVAALPYTVSVPTLFYNADLFKAAGLDPNKAPARIGEVRSDAQAITAAGHHGVYFGIVDPGKSDYLTQSVIDSAGGSTIDKDGKVTLDSPEAVKGIQAVQSLTTDGLQPAVTVEDALADFAAGNLGMFVASTAVLGNLKKAAKDHFELRSAGFPSFSDKPASPTFSGAGLIILSQDQAKQKAAWQFVKFLTSEAGYTLITQGIGYLPLRANLADDPKYLKDYFAKDALLLPALKQLDAVSPYLSFPGPHGNQATVLLQDGAISPIVLRGADAKATLTDVANRIRSLVGKK